MDEIEIVLAPVAPYFREQSKENKKQDESREIGEIV